MHASSPLTVRHVHHRLREGVQSAVLVVILIFVLSVAPMGGLGHPAADWILTAAVVGAIAYGLLWHIAMLRADPRLLEATPEHLHFFGNESVHTQPPTLFVWSEVAEIVLSWPDADSDYGSMRVTSRAGLSREATIDQLDLSRSELEELIRQYGVPLIVHE